jgi:hypothetical protein
MLSVWSRRNCFSHGIRSRSPREWRHWNAPSTSPHDDDEQYYYHSKLGSKWPTRPQWVGGAKFQDRDPNSQHRLPWNNKRTVIIRAEALAVFSSDETAIQVLQGIVRWLSAMHKLEEDRPVPWWFLARASCVECKRNWTVFESVVPNSNQLRNKKRNLPRSTYWSTSNLSKKKRVLVLFFC